MKTKETKTFDSVTFFRAIKEKLAKKMEGMNLVQKKEFMQQVREGKIKIA
ncbi:MAG: hypothetical protein QM535_18370 [Limnohabitans sp.]|nr:hypothetical protein [Limnohabitans sp.]